MNPIICPVRNCLRFTKAALKTFLHQDVPDVQVLILDNDSRDGTREYLWTQPSVATVCFHSPKSVAECWNFGLRHVFGSGAAHALVVNNDVELRLDTYRHLLADDGLFVTAVGTRDPKKIESYDTPDPSRKRPHPDFSCFLIRRECYEKVGSFDESFEGAYVEDCDYHLRMHHAGIEAVCLDLPFLHYGAQTLANAEDEEAAEIRRRADANRARFRQRHGVEVGSEGYYRLFGHGAPT